jgi:hypothetical protein
VVISLAAAGDHDMLAVIALFGGADIELVSCGGGGADSHISGDGWLVGWLAGSDSVSVMHDYDLIHDYDHPENAYYSSPT